MPGAPGIMFYNSMICGNMARIGWTKEKIRARLAELLFVAPEEIRDRTDVRRAAAAAKVDFSKLPARIPLMTDPQNVNFVCAGGKHPSLAMWLAGVTLLGNVEIQLPKNWDDLLGQAEQDLDPFRRCSRNHIKAHRRDAEDSERPQQSQRKLFFLLRNEFCYCRLKCALRLVSASSLFARAALFHWES